jgi:hypothetical protein
MLLINSDGTTEVVPWHKANARRGRMYLRTSKRCKTHEDFQTNDSEGPRLLCALRGLRIEEDFTMIPMKDRRTAIRPAVARYVQSR